MVDRFKKVKYFTEDIDSLTSYGRNYQPRFVIKGEKPRSRFIPHSSSHKSVSQQCQPVESKTDFKKIHK